MAEVKHPNAIDVLLAHARADLDRVQPADLTAEMAAGAVVVDIRPIEQWRRDGELPGALIIDRNVVEWRLDPTSPHRIPRPTPDCESSWSAAKVSAPASRQQPSASWAWHVPPTSLVGSEHGNAPCPANS